MELESSLPYPQEPATCSYPDPTPSSPHNPFPLPEDPSQYYPPTYALVSLVVSFPLVSPSNIIIIIITIIIITNTNSTATTPITIT
jgi:hypothetical protein